MEYFPIANNRRVSVDTVTRILAKVQENEFLDSVALDFFMKDKVFTDVHAFYAVEEFRTDVREALQKTNLLRYAQGMGYRITHAGSAFLNENR